MEDKWISIKKEMPEMNTRVDVWVNQERWPCRITDAFTDKHRKHFFKADLKGSWEKIENVTHWMSIPEPPKS